MYRTAVTIVFFSALAIIAADLGLRLVLRPKRYVDSVPAGTGLVGWVRMLVNLVGFASLAVVASTGFSALTTNDNVVTGDRLIWHVGSAPAFAIAAVVVTLFWAHRNRFTSSDGSRLAVAGGWATPLRKLFFWLAVALTVPTLVSIIAAMYPIFSSDDQHGLVNIHRYCALFLTAFACLFAYFALVTWRERSKD